MRDVGGRIAAGVDIGHLLAKHGRWLDRLGIRNKPWLVFGAAPDPTVPPEISATHLRVDINNSGRTAASLGLGRAALTIRARKKTWEEHPRLDTRGLLWIHDRHPLSLWLKLLVRPHRHVGSIARLTDRDREGLVAEVANTCLEGVGDLNKVTNGVFAACYGLTMGVPQIVIAGVSLSKTGHSYDHLDRRRRQVEEDTHILRALRDRPSLFTTEPELARTTGIRLWKK